MRYTILRFSAPLLYFRVIVTRLSDMQDIETQEFGSRYKALYFIQHHYEQYEDSIPAVA